MRKQIMIAIVATASLFPVGAHAQDASAARAALTSCIAGAVDRFDDGMASPESILLATRYQCSAEESQMLQALKAEIEARFPDVSEELKQEFVFTMRSETFQNAAEGIAAVVLSRRVAKIRNAPNQ